jgi:hypothetical protein
MELNTCGVIVEVKEVSLDPGSPDGKVVHISTTLNPK